MAYYKDSFTFLLVTEVDMIIKIWRFSCSQDGSHGNDLYLYSGGSCSVTIWIETSNIVVEVYVVFLGTSKQIPM
jgi:hypothetical protein